jgi:hypothetical protein
MGTLQHKERLLRKIKLNNGGGASVEWIDRYFDPDAGTYVNNEDGRTSDALVHEDLKTAMATLADHLAIACEMVPEPKGNYAFDGTTKGLEKFSVGSVVIRGGISDPDSPEEPSPLQVFIFGNKRLKTGHKCNFGTYGIKLGAPQEPYKFVSFLDGHVHQVIGEAMAYLDGKHSPPAQQAMDFQDRDPNAGADIQLNALPEHEDDAVPAEDGQ